MNERDVAGPLETVWLETVWLRLGELAERLDRLEARTNEHREFAADLAEAICLVVQHILEGRSRGEAEIKDLHHAYHMAEKVWSRRSEGEARQ